MAIASQSVAKRSRPTPLAKCVVIGASTGGPDALASLLSSLPKDVETPILIVQHLPAAFSSLLAERFTKESGRLCIEARHGLSVVSGQVYLAAGDAHMLIKKCVEGFQIALDRQGPAENFCRPAVDPLFRSAADAFGSELLGVVLTGMGEDGRRGCEVICRAGGRILVQDERSSVVWGMPGAVVAHGLAHEVVPLAEISQRMASLCRRHGGAA